MQAAQNGLPRTPLHPASAKPQVQAQELELDGEAATTTTTQTSATTTTTSVTSPTSQSDLPPAPLDELIPPTLSPQAQSVREANSGGALELVSAIAAGSLARVKNTLAQVANAMAQKVDPLLNQPLENGATALHLAVRGGHVEIVKFLLERSDISLNLVDNQGRTPFYTAIEQHNLDMAQLLKAKGADINRPRDDGDTPLHCACEGGPAAVVEWLLSALNADARVVPAFVNGVNKSGLSPLLLAVEASNEGVVRALLEQGGIDPNQPDDDGWTPLKIVVQQGNISMAELLLSHSKTTVDAAAQDGITPFYIAIDAQDLKMASLLLDHGADINAKLSNGNTALHNAAYEGRLKTVRWLLAPTSKTRTGDDRPVGAALNLSTDAGLTALHVAVQMKRVSIVGLLMAQGGIQAATKDFDGYTPLHDAVKANRADIVALLLNTPENGAFMTGPHGFTALHHVAMSKKPMSLIEAFHDVLTPEGFEALKVTPDAWGAMPVTLFTQRKDPDAKVIAALTPVKLPTPIALERTSYRRGWLIVGHNQSTWADRNLAEVGRKAGLDMNTYGDGTLNLSWREMKGLKIEGADFVLGNFHAYWDDDLQRVMLEFGHAERVPLVEFFRWLREKGVSTVMVMGCEVSLAALPLMQCFQLDPTVAPPADPEQGYEGLEYTTLGRLKKTLITLNQDAAGSFLEDCAKKLRDPAAGSTLHKRSVQPISTVACDAETHQLIVKTRGELRHDQLDGFTPEEARAFRKSQLLMHVADNELDEVKQLLTRYELNPNEIQTDAGLTAFGLACELGYAGIAKLLHEKGADIHRPNFRGETPIFVACLAGKGEAVALLLDLKADVNQKTLPSRLPMTPLMAACFRGDAAIVEALLAKGANPGIKAPDGMTAELWAKTNRHQAIVTLLRSIQSKKLS